MITLMSIESSLNKIITDEQNYIVNNKFIQVEF